MPECFYTSRCAEHLLGLMSGAAVHTTGYGDAYGSATAAAVGQKRTYADVQGGYQQVRPVFVTPALAHRSSFDAERVPAGRF